MAVRPIDANAMLNELRPVSFEAEHSAVLLSDVSKMMREWVERQPTLTPPNEWVSVYDRLPEPGERVLATDCGFVGEFYINERGQWQRYNVNCHALLMALDILYWMPFPEMPKEDE